MVACSRRYLPLEEMDGCDPFGDVKFLILPKFRATSGRTKVGFHHVEYAVGMNAGFYDTDELPV